MTWIIAHQMRIASHAARIREAIIAIYRLSVLDGKGHVVDVYEPECSSDEEAYAKADLLVDCRAIDIWQGNRWIAFIDGSDPARIALAHHVSDAH